MAVGATSMAGQNPEQYDVFLSYAREDAARIRPLVSALEAEGWTIFWDRRIPPAESWRSYIGLRLRTASVVVVVWSEYSIQSDWVITEAEEAHRRRALVPTSIDAVDAPLGLNQIQAADLVEWIAGGGGALPEDLRAAIQRRIPANVGTRAASSGNSIESTSESKGKVGEEHQEAARMLPSKAPQQIASAENDEVGGIDIHAPELASVQRKPRTAVYAGVLALIVAVAASAYGIVATVAPRQQERQQAELASPQRVAAAAEEARLKAEAERQSTAAEAATQGDNYYYGRGGVPQDYAQALSWYRKAAEQGNAGGQTGLGRMYVYGQGIPQDYAQALSWYRKAAEQGYATGQANLGLMYVNGWGVPPDYAQALSWFRKAAEQGNAGGQVGLGAMYTSGQSVPQDYAQALSWYRKAAEQGNASGQTGLGRMYVSGWGVPQDYAQALSWYRKAAEQGYATAQASLGVMYERGWGVPRDYAQALSWYRKAAEQGYPTAQANLGLMYVNGWGVPQDYAQALSWFRKAAEQGNASGETSLGVMYERGWGIPQDYAQALSWYRKAAEQGWARALHNLGSIYENGRGVAQNYVEAYKWYSLAVSRSAEAEPTIHNDAVERRNKLASSITPSQIAEAESLAQKWKPSETGLIIYGPI